MLSVDARDGAGRLGILKLPPRALLFPNVLWVGSELGPSEAHWEPVLSRAANQNAFLLHQTGLHEPRPASGAGQLLIERRLEAPPAMLAGDVQLRDLDGHVAALSGALALMRNPRRFAPALARARTQAGYARLLYAPGVGEPAHFALLAWAGVDLFDSVPLSLAAARGIYLTSHGAFPQSQMNHAECNCPACHEEPARDFTEEELRRHNQYAAAAELGVVRNAITAGRLRELAEARVRSHPELTALLRRIDQQDAYLEERAPVQRGSPLFANTKESLRRPDVVRFRRRVESRYEPRTEAPILLLLPCSHRKPYSRSRTHRAFHDAIWNAHAGTLVHEVVVTSPLGLVPRELELTFPAAHYDVPVTGEWDDEEGAMIRTLLDAHLAKHAYAHIISHLPKHTYELVKGLLPPTTIVTCQGEDATAPGEVARLGRELERLVGTTKPRPFAHTLRERLHGLATYQFGAAAADALCADTHATGKWPFVKLATGRDQVAMLPGERGLLSLTIEGAKRVAAAGAYRVEIEDFAVTGSVFAVGVTGADPQIRVGDEVVVVHKDEVRAVGVAAMTGPEMVEMERGEAVKVRHHA